MHRTENHGERVLVACRDAHVTQMLCAFPDILGFVMAQQTPVEELKRMFDRGILIDGSSLEGFARIEESDLRAKPDPRTFKVLPWSVAGEQIGIILCDVVEPNDQPFIGDPRGVLRRVLKPLTAKGWRVNLGPELEFFLSRSADKLEPLDDGKYFELAPDQNGLVFRTKILAAMRQLNIATEVAHHEVAPSQHEVDLRYNEALAMADTVFLYRWIVKELANQSGLHATFMPKPAAGINGSGMHVHASIFEGDRNLFFDQHDPYHLSQMGRHFMAGWLKYVPEITLVLNQWVNSYKRLVPGFEAPVYVCWGNRNRSALIRRPGYEVGKEAATRIELRSPDPACNPYLAFALIIAAGLHGIEEELEVPASVEKDVYHLTAAQRNKLQISTLPSDLAEAINRFEGSELARVTLGQHVFQKLLDNKRAELERWRTAVTDYELREYLAKL